MGKSGEWFAELRNEETEVDDFDYQYFQWLTDEQYQEELIKKEKEFHDKYGHGLTFHLKWTEYLSK